ncbi:dihydroorotase [Companilactobacillus sp. RD055328]|uniref:dihydroorotase n=1 Tax=Companilactobacillus sp. RD055328 TaxID=2916634 RepID=UPI001FC8B1D4|nr:dihydroorotase [Companilactobacillus sp. RD055328]GKQ42789.1 dihydroorotase [Companilactobacillus sp. RD055328]
MIIKNGRVYLNGNYEKKDLRIQDGIITEISEDIKDESDSQIFDAQYMVINPGFVDPHVHLRQPGKETEETIESGTKAAARGGFTTVGAMPNVTPVPDTTDKFNKQLKLNSNADINVVQYAPITVNETGNELVDFVELQKLGAFAFSNDGKGVTNTKTMFEAMKKIKQLNSHLAAHIEDADIFGNGVINEGTKSTEFNLPGISRVAETAQLARDLALVAETGVHYHACHISTKESVEMIRVAKEKGLNVTCEVTPHHLLLSEEDIVSDDALYKMNPPLRAKEDKDALIKGIQEGVIDIIATDHAPHVASKKEGGFIGSAFGISGIETVFPLIYTKLVKESVIPLTELINLISTKPAHIFNLSAPKISVGEKANLNIIDIMDSYSIDTNDFLSKGKNTPFNNWLVYGKIKLTVCNGKVVYGG